MKKTFLGVEKPPKEVWKVNLNNCLKIGSYVMLITTLLQSFIILGYEVDDIISENENWHCNIWPKEFPCLSRQGYACAFRRLIFTTHLVVLLAAGMITRNYLLMVPWIIFRFFFLLVSSSINHH